MVSHRNRCFPWIVILFVLGACQQSRVPTEPNPLAQATVDVSTVESASTPSATITPSILIRPTDVLPPFTNTPTMLQPTPSQISSPDHLPSEGLPALPERSAEPASYAQILVEFLNADPKHIQRLDELLALWEQQRMPPGIKLTANGERYRNVALMDDSETQLLIDVGSLLILERSIDGQYQHTATYSSQHPGNSAIWMVDDINDDGIKEIVLNGEHCGAHTCFTTIDIIQWEGGTAFRRLLFLQESYATVMWADGTGDGIVDLIVQGGTVGSAGAGIQRTKTHIYAWDGRQYQETATTVDPVDSQHPYWKLIDGYHAMGRNEYGLALQLYHDAGTDQPPYPNIGIEGNQPLERIRALAHFQQMLAYVYLGDSEQAQKMYETAQQEDGEYGAWTKAFMESYTQNMDIPAACKAAKATIPEAQLFIPGYSYETHMMDVKGLLCRTLP